MFASKKAYKRHLQGQGKEAEYLDGTIEFVDMMSRLVDTFADRRPISSLHDHRMVLNEQVLTYLQKGTGCRRSPRTEQGGESKTPFILQA